MQITSENIFQPIFIIAGGLLLYYGFNRMHKYRLISDTPTSKIRSMAMGIVEIAGKAFMKTPFKSPFSNSDCVYFRYEVKELQQRSTGKSTYTTWVTVVRGERKAPFLVRDDTGEVYVNPAGAEFNLVVKKCFLQKAGFWGSTGRIRSLMNAYNNGGVLDVGKLNLKPLDPKKKFGFYGIGDRKYYEYYIGVDENAYVLGTAANDSHAPNKVIIKKGQNNPAFIISDRSEKELIKNLKWRMIGSFIFGGLLILLGVILITKSII